jgi:hypothetical protein
MLSLSKIQVIIISVLFAVLTNLLLSVAANLISAKVEALVGNQDLTLPIFLILMTILLLALQSGLSSFGKKTEQTPLKNGIVSPVDYLMSFLQVAWGAFVMLLGLIASGWIIVYLVENGMYPSEIAPKSLTFWGSVLVWIFPLCSFMLGLGFAIYQLESAARHRARIDARRNWSKWQRAINQLKQERRYMVHQDWLQKRMPSHSDYETQEAMVLYSEEFGVDLEKEIVEIPPSPFHQSSPFIDPSFSWRQTSLLNKNISQQPIGYPETKKVEKYILKW